MIEFELHAPRKLVFFMRRRSLPESWTEIPEGRRLLILKKILQSEKNEALRIATQIPKRIWRKMAGSDKQTLWLMCQWGKLEPSPVAIFEKFTHRGTTYHMPKNNFENAVCVEYPLADEFLTAYLEGKGNENLLYLVATLCRPENPDPEEVQRREDKRVELHSRMDVEKNAERLHNLQHEIQIAVLLYFIGVKQLVHRLYGSWLFEAPPEEGEEAGTPDPLGWWGMYMDVAAGDITKLDQIHQSNFHTFCTMEVRKRKQAKDQYMKQRLGASDFGEKE